MRGRILRTRPIQCEDEGGFEVRILTCQRHVLDALWALKSFLHHSQLRPRIVIHDDGSLDASSRALLQAHLPGLVIVARERADLLLRDALEPYPCCTRYRFASEAPLASKLFDVYRLPRSYRISRGSAEPSAVAGHFVNDGSRDLMYLAGVERLNQERFLSAI